jgi:hypothetical protein
MYDNKFVAVVKARGQILREDKDTVLIPFGEEYTILMKNLNGQRALVKVQIDGQDVVDGGLIVNANSEIELERFVKDLNSGNRFKFIQKTKKIQEHRGDKIDDGMIRIEFQFERPTPTYTAPIWNYSDSCNWQLIKGSDISSDSQILPHNVTVSNHVTLSGSSGKFSSDTSNVLATNTSSGVVNNSNSTNASTNVTLTANTYNVRGLDNSLPQIEEGITVKGSVSNQKFKQGYIGLLEDEKHVIILQLKGYKDSGKPVEQPLTVKTPKKCSTCGRTNKSNVKYCAECGTYLE